MDANVIKELQNGLNAAYINGSVAVNLAYKPAFVSNNPEEGKKVISSVEDQLFEICLMNLIRVQEAFRQKH